MRVEPVNAIAGFPERIDNGMDDHSQLLVTGFHLRHAEAPIPTKFRDAGREALPSRESGAPGSWLWLRSVHRSSCLKSINWGALTPASSSLDEDLCDPDNLNPRAQSRGLRLCHFAAAQAAGADAHSSGGGADFGVDRT